jgi:hypothetical protein
LLLAVMFVCAFALGAPARAADFTVTNLDNSGNVSAGRIAAGSNYTCDIRVS